MTKNKQDGDQNADPKDSNVEELENKVVELNDKYLRAIADYQNLAKQTEAWKTDFVAYANVSLIVKLLEVLDDLEKAEENLKDDGLALVINKFKKVLESEGLEVVELEGKEYDPNLAEVISMYPGEKENIVTRVLQKGYKLRGKIVRPAKVIVSKV